MYPRTVNRFIPWSKAMVDGATVDKPDYGKKTIKVKASNRRKRRKRRKKHAHGSKD